MDIVNLRDVPQLLPLLAAWHHVQWEYLNPGRTLAQRIADMQPQLLDELVPSTWVAIESGAALGSASLLQHDMDTHPELAPWLASVFVAPEFRRLGIAATLVRRVMHEARAGGIDTVHLFTPDQARFYAGLGWEVVVEENYMGDRVTLMQARL